MRYQNLIRPAQMQNQYPLKELLYCAHLKRHLILKNIEVKKLKHWYG